MFSIVIYTDYSTAIQIARQIIFFTSSTNKLNLKLIRASQYLFEFHLIIRYKTNKSNVVLDALFKF